MALDMLVDATQLDAGLTSVADAIRAKGGTSGQLAFPAGFVSAVQAIPTGVTPSGTINITTNGTHDVTNYATANVNVPQAVTVNEVTLTADVANANELCVAIMPSLPRYKRAVFWYKSGTAGLQGRIMGAYVYKSGDTSFGGGRTRYSYGYSAADGTAKAGDTYCWIGGLPTWN